MTHILGREERSCNTKIPQQQRAQGFWVTEGNDSGVWCDDNN